MARFRNTTNRALWVPEGSPQTVPPEGLFDVPDDRAAAFEESPHVAPAATRKPKPAPKPTESE